jgi:hypothetical protein
MNAMIKIAQIWNNNFKEFADELEQTADTSHIILDFLLEVRYIPVDRESFDRIINFAFANNIPVTILTPWDRYAFPLIDFQQLRYARINIVHWETFWFRRTYTAWLSNSEKVAENLSKGLDITDMQISKPPLEIKFPYITLNNIAKRHRCLVMDILAKHNLIDTGAIVWRDILHDCTDIRDTFPEGVTDSVFRNFPYQYWKPKRMFLDQEIGIWLKNQETLPIEFTQSFMQLVTESDDEAVFFSEKTATPILFNKPFLVASCAGFHRNLESQGFALYNELFDYSFDGESNINYRYEGLVENVKRYASLDSNQLNKIYTDIFEKLVHNKQHALKLINEVPSKIQEVIDMLKRENVTDYPGPLNIFL